MAIFKSDPKRGLPMLFLLCALPGVCAAADTPVMQPSGESPAALSQGAAASPESTGETSGSSDISTPLKDGGDFLKKISPYEPLYFLFGWRHATGWDAKFQLSLRYLFGQHIYLGYTQTSVWDLSAESAPFHDSSYRPSLFYYYNDDKKDISSGYIFRLMTGFEHESNGQGGPNSRSINVLFARPFFMFANDGGDHLFRVAPKVVAYLDKSENQDIANYRGYGDLLLVFDFVKNHGVLNGLQVSTDLRKGNRRDYGSVQVDLSYPIGSITYAHLQYFAGWGETILDYNKKLPSHVRLGIMVVRW
jgi:outer membrane phospholipase A